MPINGEWKLDKKITTAMMLIHHGGGDFFQVSGIRYFIFNLAPFDSLPRRSRAVTTYVSP